MASHESHFNQHRNQPMNRYPRIIRLRLERHGTFRYPRILIALLAPLLVLAWPQASVGRAFEPLTDEFANPAERAYLQRHPVIKKCVDPYWMPLEGIDQSGRHVGVIADILAIIEQRLNIRFELVPTANWPESLARLRAGECDIVTSDTADGPSPAYYRKTSPPFLDLRNVYITRKETPIQLNFNEIKHKPIGIPDGYPTIPLIREAYGEVNIVTVANIDDGLIRVSKGELYAFTDFLPVCSYSIQSLGLTNLKVAGHLDISLPTSMAVRADHPELLRIMNRALAEIDDHTLNLLLMKWIDVEYDVKMDWRQVLQYLPFLLIILLIAFYSNRKLRQINKRLDESNAKLLLLNETDALTKLKNRRFLDHVLPELNAVACRNRLSLGIALFDLDHFKRLNDQYGHLAGDQCLMAFAEVLRGIFQRESDFLIRFGGEEFLLVCLGENGDVFEQGLEQCCAKVDSQSVTLASGDRVSFTVSIGYVFHPEAPAHWCDELINEADRQLYQAKAAGRNRVLGVWSPGNTPESPPPSSVGV